MKQTKIGDLIENQIAVSEEMTSIANEIITYITPFYDELRNPQNICAKSFEALVNALKSIISFEAAFLKSSNHTLLSIAELFNSSEKLPALFNDLEQSIPSADELAKLSKSKTHKSFIDSLAAKNVDLPFWFHFPYLYIKTWVIFWTRALEIVTIDDDLYSVYLQCRAALKKIEMDQQKIRIMEMFKPSLEKLYKHSEKQKVFIPKDSALLWCVSGHMIQHPQPVPASLFIFEDRVALMREDKLVISSNLLNTWIVRSSMFPAKRNVVDVLCTKQSFAFEPLNENESIALWKTWKTVGSWCPNDWSIFQPVIIDPDEKETLEWHVVNK
jgi:hypothetical protein